MRGHHEPPVLPLFPNKVGESYGAPQQKQGEGLRSVNSPSLTPDTTPSERKGFVYFNIETARGAVVG